MDADWLSAISAAVSAAAVLTAGGFAYLRFVRGRVHHTDLTITVDPTIVLIDGQAALKVRILLANTGTLRLHVPDGCEQRLLVQAADAAIWRDARAHGNVLWSEGVVANVDLMQEEGFKFGGYTFEPGERSEQSVLLPLGPDEMVAYKVSVFAEACASRTLRPSRDVERWATHSILVRERNLDERQTSTRTEPARPQLGLQSMRSNGALGLPSQVPELPESNGSNRHS